MSGFSSRLQRGVFSLAAVIVLSGCASTTAGSASDISVGDSTLRNADSGVQFSAKQSVEHADFVDTIWTGADAGISMKLLLNDDGHVTFLSWNGEHYDSSVDTWSVDEGVFTLSITGVSDIGGITYEGPADLAAMTLSGWDKVGGTNYNLELSPVSE
ncbi:hypothetical protein [Humidisolicoccus flavus]|uniref:hypothetical protein n=1 Tax=Humidisolicoccus flavus TaxID=3111414 RepID=UPI0032476EA9